MLLFHNYCPLILHFNNFKFPSMKNDVCQVSLKLSLWCWRRRLLNVVRVFLLFRFNLPVEQNVKSLLKDGQLNNKWHAIRKLTISSGEESFILTIIDIISRSAHFHQMRFKFVHYTVILKILACCTILTMRFAIFYPFPLFNIFFRCWAWVDYFNCLLWRNARFSSSHLYTKTKRMSG